MKNGVVHQSKVGGVGWAWQLLVVEGIAFGGHPSAPRGGLTDATIDAEDHLDTFSVRDLARACSGKKSKEISNAAVDGSEVEKEVDRFEGVKVVHGGEGKNGDGSNGELGHVLEEGGTIISIGKVAVLFEHDLEIALETCRKTLKHGKGILNCARVGPEGEGRFDVGQGDGLIIGDKV